jgi:AmmeMemoRadiSam system protein B
MLLTQKRGATKANVLTYRTSGDVNHDYTEVVGYLAGAMHGG